MQNLELFSFDENGICQKQIYIFLSIGGNNIRETIQNPLKLVIEARQFSNNVSIVIDELKNSFPYTKYPNLKLF